MPNTNKGKLRQQLYWLYSREVVELCVLHFLFLHESKPSFQIKSFHIFFSLLDICVLFLGCRTILSRAAHFFSCYGGTYVQRNALCQPCTVFPQHLLLNHDLNFYLTLSCQLFLQALLSGCSAGGVASIIHCDEFRGLLPRRTTVKCLADAGLFLDVYGLHPIYLLMGFCLHLACNCGSQFTFSQNAVLMWLVAVA